MGENDFQSTTVIHRVGIPLTGLTPPHICAVPIPGYEVPTSYVLGALLSFCQCERKEG